MNKDTIIEKNTTIENIKKSVSLMKEDKDNITDDLISDLVDNTIDLLDLLVFNNNQITKVEIQNLNNYFSENFDDIFRWNPHYMSYFYSVLYFLNNKKDKAKEFISKFVSLEFEDLTNKHEILTSILNYYDVYHSFSKEFYNILLDESIKIIKEKYSENTIYFTLLAFKEIDKDNTDLLKDYMTNASNLDNENWLANFILGDTYYNDKNFYSSINYYNRVLSFKNNINEYENAKNIILTSLIYIGHCYYFLNNFEKAQYYYEEQLKIEANSETKSFLTWVLIKQKKYSEALKFVNEAIKENKKQTNKVEKNYYEKALWRKMYILEKQKQFKEALNIIDLLKIITKSKIAIEKKVKSLENKISVQNKTKEKKENIKEEIIKEDVEEMELIQENIIEARNFPPNIKPDNKFIDNKPYINNEKSLQNLIEGQINNGIPFYNRKLKMYNEEGRYGKEYRIPNIGGRIDLLTIDIETNDLVIIEFKKGESDDKVAGQILRYLNWVKENLAKANQNVKGIICVNQSTEKLRYAVKDNSDIEIVTWDFGFNKVK